MRLNRVVLLLCLLSTVAWLGMDTQEARACGGGGGRDHEIFAKGTVIDTDEFGQNVIVQVEGYYKGIGPKNLLFVRRDPRDLDWLTMGYIECVLWKTPLFVNDTIYFSASRRDDGSYEDAGWYDDTVARFNSPEDKFELYSEWYNEREYLDKYAKVANKKLVPPNNNGNMPLVSPLIVTTENSSYILPIDGEPPVKQETSFQSDTQRCFTNRCDVIEASTGISLLFDIGSNIEIEHEAAYVAPRGGLVAFWTNKGIEIHTFKFLIDFPSKIFFLNEDSNKSALKLARYAQWSSDGRKLAYNDLKGLWIWDVNTDKPRLVKPIDKDGTMPTARYFSPTGKYLAITDGEIRKTLDLQTNQLLPDGIVSPDERWLLVFGKHDAQSDLMPVGLCRLAQNECDQDDSGYMHRELSHVKQIEWIGINRFLALIAPWEEGYGAFDPSKGYYLLTSMITDFGNINPIARDTYREVPENKAEKGFAFAYDEMNNTLAVINDKSTLLINKRQYSIGRYLDGDIVSIRWLPSLLYREPR